MGGAAVLVALSTASLSLLGFGFDAVVDASASIALVWRFAVEARQPSRAARVERLAERVVGSAMVLFSVYLGAASALSLASGHGPGPSAFAIVLLVASVAVLPPLAVLKLRVARELGSAALRADSLLTAVAAVLAAISLLGQVAASALGLWWADAAGALVVAVIVLREGMLAVRASGRAARDP